MQGRVLLRIVAPGAAVLVALWSGFALATPGDDACLECHGSVQQVKDAAEATGAKVDDARAVRLVVQRAPAGAAHTDMACVDCHPKATEVPHPTGMLKESPCVTCHEDALKQVNTSAHRDAKGGSDTAAPCWACHSAHDVRPAKDPKSTLAPQNVASRCLQCHDKQEYLAGVHGHGVELAGLDASATCVSCHGGHDIQSPTQTGSRVARRNISFTCGKCHGRVAETYRRSVHGAALTEKDNPDVPTCADCHTAHATLDPRSPRFRLASPQMCGHCHGDPKRMGKYGLSTAVFKTYVADFHGTTAELFRAVTPDQPLNQAVCFDCHGYHDVQRVHGVGQQEIDRRLLVRCQACHPGATFNYLSAWTGHYEPSPQKYPVIYWVKAFYKLIIPGTVGFFLLYIAIDWNARRRERRASRSGEGGGERGRRS